MQTCYSKNFVRMRICKTGQVEIRQRICKEKRVLRKQPEWSNKAALNIRVQLYCIYLKPIMIGMEIRICYSQCKGRQARHKAMPNCICIIFNALSQSIVFAMRGRDETMPRCAVLDISRHKGGEKLPHQFNMLTWPKRCVSALFFNSLHSQLSCR